MKYCQGLPKLCRTDVALGLLGISSIEAYIDLQKLNFLGILCHADTTFMVKYLFTFRLHQYRLKSRATQKGFVTDVFRILRKYSLETYINIYVLSGTFPTKAEWKRLCKTGYGTWKNRHGAHVLPKVTSSTVLEPYRQK